ncbi:MAG: hypothetical protein NZ960_05505 [Candidatus Kapabacteria bacterium]|nr:hypothetical protein [Candidatus Kapabacteria bacterium]MDW8012670.1 hypothetical protein [Bacteroidota bacterium]
MEVTATDDPLIGPLPSRLLAAHLLQFLQRQYRLRPCTDPLQNAPNEPACFYAELGTCSAPCNGMTSEPAYRQQAQRLLQDALYGIPSWAQAVFSGMQRYADQWAFEQAAALRPLWRFLHRWGRSSLPLWLQACSFLLFVPATGNGWELTCFVRGSFRGHRVIQSPSDKVAIQAFLSECLQCPSQPTWLDIARLDALSRWLAQQSPEGCRLMLLSDGLPVPGIIGQPAESPIGPC